MSSYHKSVLLQEAIHLLHVQKGKKYIDATLGGGGHAGEIIERGGLVLGIDVDSESLEFVKENFKFQVSNSELKVACGNFKDIDIIAREHGFEAVNGILFDLGVSSHQFDQGTRGFSFRSDAPLDMRMDINLTVKAKDLINGLTKGELYELFTKLGEEHFARRISEAIIRARQVKLIETTVELADIVRSAYPKVHAATHPATKVFQALRIAVNDELNSLKEALPKAFSLLEVGGRIAVISFHSLEDRIVKKIFLDFVGHGGRIITAKPILPTDEEIEENPRSRSAKLRVIERL